MNGNQRIGPAKDRTNALSDLTMSPRGSGVGGDMFLHSESPRAQQIRLFQKLREELENNSTGRVRYIDPELFLRNQSSPIGIDNGSNEDQHRRSSEVQTRTLNFSNNCLQTTDKSHMQATETIPQSANTDSSTKRNKLGTNNFLLGPSSTSAAATTASVRDGSTSCDIDGSSKMLVDNACSGGGDDGSGDKYLKNVAHAISSSSRQNNLVVGDGKDCQVCLIREVKEDLINVTKLIQERNEQLAKLKAKQLRSFFERQMLD